MTDRGTSFGFGIVGSGVIASTHAEAIAANGARLVATYDFVPERAAALAARFSARAASSLDDLVTDPAVEVVTICTPSGGHLEVVERAAAAGKHLFVEKPLDVTLDRARAAVEAAERAGVTLSVVSQHRFDDSTIAVKRAVESGDLGRIVYAAAEVLWYRTQDYYDGDSWRGTLRLDGGGALMNQGIHSVDLLLHLAGDVESLSAKTALLGHTGLEVEDVAVAALRFRSGALGALVGTTAASPGFGARIEVYGDRGAARIEGDRLVHLGGALAAQEAAAPSDGANGLSAATRPEALVPEGHARQLADVLDAIRTGRPPAVTGEDAIKALELVLAVYEASRTEALVTLPLEARAIPELPA